MKQGRASSNTGRFRGMGLTPEAYGGTAPYGTRPPDGQKREPNPKAIVPAGVAQYGQRVGNHVTEQGSTSYGGVDPFGGRGFKAPGIKSDSKNRGSQGKY